MSIDTLERSPDPNERPTREARSWTWKRFLLVLLIVFAIALAIVGFSIFNTLRKIPESYAAWTTGNLIIDYLNTHTNQWPRRWEDLEQATNCLRYVPIEKLRDQVRIDWNSDFDQLLESARHSPSTPIRVVTRPDGSKLHAIWGADTEPNRKVMGYLLWTLTQTNSPTNDPDE